MQPGTWRGDTNEGCGESRMRSKGCPPAESPLRNFVRWVARLGEDAMLEVRAIRDTLRCWLARRREAAGVTRPSRSQLFDGSLVSCQGKEGKSSLRELKKGSPGNTFRHSWGQPQSPVLAAHGSCKSCLSNKTFFSEYKL